MVNIVATMLAGNCEKYVDLSIKSFIDHVDKLVVIYDTSSRDSTILHLTDWVNKYPKKVIILDREYNIKLDLRIGGRELDGTAIVIFNRDGKSVSTALPDANEIKLSEGNYELIVYVYGNSSIIIPGSKKTHE